MKIVRQRQAEKTAQQAACLFLALYLSSTEQRQAFRAANPIEDWVIATKKDIQASGPEKTKTGVSGQSLVRTGSVLVPRPFSLLDGLSEKEASHSVEIVEKFSLSFWMRKKLEGYKSHGIN